MASLEDWLPHTENSGASPLKARLIAFLNPPLLPVEHAQAEHLLQQVTVGAGFLVTLAAVADVVLGLRLEADL